MTQQLAQWACLVIYSMYMAIMILAVIKEVSDRNSQSAVAVAIATMMSGIFGLFLKAAGTFTMIF